MLKGWTSSPSIVKSDWNTLKIVANGSTLAFYINDILVWTGTDTSFTRGQAGLGMYRGSGIERLSVDWATLDLIGPLTSLEDIGPVEPGQRVLPMDPGAPYGPERAPK